MAGLIPAGDPPEARCSICGAIAAGPCARCRRMTCPDCCELVTGAGTLALCSRCAGKSTGVGYLPLIAWLLGIIAVLGAIATLLYLLRR